MISFETNLQKLMVLAVDRESKCPKIFVMEPTIPNLKMLEDREND